MCAVVYVTGQSMGAAFRKDSFQTHLIQVGLVGGDTAHFEAPVATVFKPLLDPMPWATLGGLADWLALLFAKELHARNFTLKDSADLRLYQLWTRDVLRNREFQARRDASFAKAFALRAVPAGEMFFRLAVVLKMYKSRAHELPDGWAVFHVTCPRETLASVTGTYL